MPKDPYIKRTIDPVLQKAIKEFPAVILRGAGHSGKTTLLKRFSEKLTVMSLLSRRIFMRIIRHLSSVHCHLVFRLFRLTFTQIR